MSNTYKLLARTVQVSEISSFKLEEGKDLNQRVAEEIDNAISTGKLDRMATRVGLPPLVVTQIAEGENLSGGENHVSIDLYAPNGTPLGSRQIRVDAAGSKFNAFGIETDIDNEVFIGTFDKFEVAEQVALFWRNGHLNIQS
jgi:hypothetical protein